MRPFPDANAMMDSVVAKATVLIVVMGAAGVKSVGHFGLDSEVFWLVFGALGALANWFQKIPDDKKFPWRKGVMIALSGSFVGVLGGMATKTAGFDAWSDIVAMALAATGHGAFRIISTVLREASKP